MYDLMANLSQLKKPAEYMAFVEWTALPSTIRQPLLQKELADELKVEEATLSDWKQREGFWDDVKECMKSWGKGKTPDVIQGLFTKAAKTGDPAAAKLWLQIFDEFVETSAVLDPRKDIMERYGITDGGQADDSAEGSSTDTA